jgi:hypothetical protein
LSLTFKGFNYVSYYNTAYSDNDSLTSLVSTNANAAALSYEWGINANTDTVYADSAYTPTLTLLGSTITEAAGDGLSVMVRPLIDFLNASDSGSYGKGDFRAYFNPGAAGSAAANGFFASYQSMMVSAAEQAQADHAPLLCIGAELDGITGLAYKSYWTSIIDAIRNTAHYTGALTYSALRDDNLSPWQDSIAHTGLAAGTGNIATQVSFWSELNYVGIDEYAPLSNTIGSSTTNPTVAQLTQGWTQTPTDSGATATTYQVTGNQSLISYFESVSTATGLPLLFTEIGYPNATDAATQPYLSSTNVVDNTLQANLYQAFFDAWKADGNSSLAGVYFWNWDPNAGEVGPGHGVNFSPQGLAAQTVVTNGFAATLTEPIIVPQWGNGVIDL